MAAEPPQLSQEHRPLPSVDMPLLRHERRASRIRTVASASVGIGTASVAIALAAYGYAPWRRASTQQPEPADLAAQSEPVPSQKAPAAMAVAPTPEDAGAESADAHEPSASDDNAPRIVKAFGESKSFRGALQRVGLAADEVAELETALQGVVDFRRCKPSDTMVVERDRDGLLKRFEYHASVTEYAAATRDRSGELKARRIKVPVDIKRMSGGGVIRTSLGEALERVGLRRSLVGTFIEVFDGRINFTTDSRQGDQFRIVVSEESIAGKFFQYGVAHAVEYAGQRTGIRRAFWYEAPGIESGYYDEAGHSLQGGWLRTPLRYDRISSRFNPRRMHPILKRIVPHHGVDYAAGTGTAVWAAAAGRITLASRKGANGNLVAIRHSGGYETLYAHLLRFAKGIKPGIEVKMRQTIGYVGSTGRSTGPHLHFALKRNGRFVDPLAEINGPGRRMPAAYLRRFRAHVRKSKAELTRIALPGAPPVQEAESDADAPMD